MRPVRASVDVPYRREQVYDFLDVMANHEPFTNHMMRDWEYSGPERGVGSKARVKTDLGAGRTDVVEIEVISGERPVKIIEQNTGAGGRRVANGTYILEELPGGHTRVTFEYSWQRAPLSERLAAPIVRHIVHGRTQEAMQRLAQELTHRQTAGKTAKA
ncbi:MAG: SRPBCC family protein [Solirubrobacteraceae bacterium]